MKHDEKNKGTNSTLSLFFTIEFRVFFVIVIFSVQLGWLPSIYDTTHVVVDWDTFKTQLKQMVMPVMVLALQTTAMINRFMRATMLDNLNQDYVRTARAKGLSEFRVVVVHALRGGLTPVIAFLGPAMAGLLAGSFVVETIFGIPGLGRFYVEAAFNRDYTMILGTSIFFSCLIISFNLLSDLVAASLNPKLRDQ